MHRHRCDNQRYRIEEPGKTLERGRDDKGMWARSADEVFKLQGRDHEQERATVRDHIRLASQLLGYLHPKSTLAKLEAPGKPEAVDFELGRRVKIAAWAVSGTVKEFPVQGAADLPEDHRVALRLWVDRETSRLIAVRAHPIDAKGKPLGAPELIRLLDHRDQDGVQVPTQLLFYRMLDRGPALQLEVKISSIDLEPEVTRESLKRPGR